MKQGPDLDDAASLSWSIRPSFRPKIKADGEIEVSLWSDGMVHLWSKFHTADLWCYDYIFVCGVRDIDGNAYFVDHKSKLAGTFCSGSSTQILESTKHSIDIERFWDRIVASGTVNLVCNSGISVSFLDLLKSVSDVLEEAGPIV